MTAIAALDHLVYATQDVGKTAAELGSIFGVELQPGGSHDGLGTCNSLVGLGGLRYLEVIGPDPDQEPPEIWPFGIDRLRGPRIVSWALRVQDLPTAIESARQEGYDIGTPTSAMRTTPSGDTLRWQVAKSTSSPLEPVLPFLINWGETHHPTQSIQHVRLVGLTLSHPNPKEVRQRLRALGVDSKVVKGRSRISARIESVQGDVVEL